MLEMRSAWTKLWVSSFLVGSCFFASHEVAAAPSVVLVTFDGVRWQELFAGSGFGSTGKDKPLFPAFWQTLSKQGAVYGAPGTDSVMLVSDPSLVSLPAYQSIMAGSDQPCVNNKCGRIEVETFPERLVREGFARRDVVTFASWDRIAHAVEHLQDTTYVHAGKPPELPGMTSFASVASLAGLTFLPNIFGLSDDPPWKNARYDRATIAEALRYYGSNAPRFMFISLNDADEWGHRGNYERYTESLRAYDRYLSAIVSAIDRSPNAAETTLLVTTDHGRGEGEGWREHGVREPSSEIIWMYARGPAVKARGVVTEKTHNTHKDIRPTVEALLGVKPNQCDECGTPIASIVRN